MTYVIAEPCVDVLDKACIEECPVDCIYEGDRMLYIHPDECVDCGACEPVCPVEAIYYEDDVPDQWKEYTKANVDFFDELGSPGGASKVGKTAADPQWIMIDLGATRSVSRVRLNWEAAYGKAYRIEVSTDNQNWSTVNTQTASDGGIDDITFTAANARYVRVTGTARATQWGYSLWEMEVYGA
ncbi:ferredoxin [Kibdelosporangium lantanae]|uniref:Ferredoxin n=1 Tax=Kibdelosporangium lantanae TaxID=1497396 RepID=A0ABW3M8W1_9PSEU